MTSKFEAYDLFGILVPGLLMVGWVTICFPDAASSLSMGFPDAFSVILLTAVAVFAGHFVQAIASAIEPLVFLSWGGRPSDIGLSKGLNRYLPLESSSRIKSKLIDVMGASTDDHSHFLYAMQLSDGQNIGRARRFNSLYAYHRALLTLIVLCIVIGAVSLACGATTGGTFWQNASLFGAGLVLAILFWYRAWQQACYYVREVLLSAEHVLDDRKRKEAKPKEKEE